MVHWTLLLLLLSCVVAEYAGYEFNELSTLHKRRADQLAVDENSYNSTGNIPLSEYSALYDLYSATQGYRWVWFNSSVIGNGIPWNFTYYANPCEDTWQGITCSANTTGDTRHVLTLELSDHNLRGNLPDSIGNLTRLTFLALNDNALNGTVPRTIGANMKELSIFDMSYNFLTGPLPGHLGNLTELTVFYLYENRFTGTVPQAYGNLHKILEMGIDSNYLHGTIPESFANLAHIGLLSLYGNSLTGTIPTFFCNYSRVYQLELSQNQLGGTIPECVGNMRKLQVIELDHNKLTGTIPPSVGQLIELLQFAVSRNQLVGTLPDEIAGMQSLTQIFAYSNYFTGSLSSKLGLMTTLTEIDLSNNYFTSTVPRAFGNLLSLQYLYMDSNHLSGRIPTSLSNLSALLELYLQNNLFDGDLHQVFNSSVQRALTIVQLSDNQLTGTLPEEPFRLPEINTFVAVSNCFRGSLPSVICNNTKLTSLILDGLHSATSCRTQIFPAISKSYYSNEKFQGTIPACMFTMSNLSTLHISGNGLTGTLPSGIDISKKLVDLTISHNDLRGTIPNNFQERVWKNLDFSFNRLTGVLKSNFASKQFDFSFNLFHEIYNVSDESSASSLSLQNNRLSGAIPHSIVRVQNISVLGSNMFSCYLDKSDLPEHDDSRLNYPCGSDSFNIPYYLWLWSSAVLAAGTVWALRKARREPPSVLKNAVQCVRRWMADEDQLPQSFRYVSAMSTILCKISVACTALVIVFLMPWYAAASHYYGTYTHVYGWVVSAAFLSGYPALGYELCVMLLLLVFLIAALTYSIMQYDQEVHYQPNRFETKSRDGKYLYSQEKRTTVLQRLAVYAAYALVNITIVVGVNVLFVYVALYQSNTLLIFAQILLSFFKLFWNSVCTPFLIRLISQYLSDTTSGTGFVSIQVIVALFNNIAIPCLVVAVVSPSCFYSVFDAPPPVDSRFIYESCAEFLTDGCDLYSPEIITTTFKPPFRYDYQCSSGILTNYAPAFVYLAVAAAFITPVLKVVVQQLHKKANPGTWWFTVLDTVLPRIFKPLPLEVVVNGQTMSIINMHADEAPDLLRRDILKPYFDANIYIITLMTYLGILLTFGVVFPPLAVAMSVTMISVAWQGRLAVGRFLYCAREAGALKFVDIIEQECKGAVTIPKIRRSVLMICCYCCGFYALFLFDTLGDAVGYNSAYWVLIFLPLLPVWIYMVRSVHIRVQKKLAPYGARNYVSDDIELRPSTMHRDGSSAAGTNGSGSLFARKTGSSLGDTRHAKEDEDATYNVLQGDNSL